MHLMRIVHFSTIYLQSVIFAYLRLTNLDIVLGMLFFPRSSTAMSKITRNAVSRFEIPLHLGMAVEPSRYRVSHPPAPAGILTSVDEIGPLSKKEELKC